MSARSRALIPLSAEQQAAMQAVAVTEQRRRQGRTLSAWPYATAFFRCLNGSRRISLTDLRFFAPALTKEEFHGNRLLWLAAVDKLIESFGEVCVLPLPSDAGHRLFPSVPFREGERRRQKTTLTEQKYSRQREREAERRELEYQTCFAQAQIDLAFHT
ncbi:plasmid SOS inhibition protein A, partial [Escherichia coli]